MRAALRAVQFENVEAEAADEERGGGRRGGGRRGGSASFYVAQISVCVWKTVRHPEKRRASMHALASRFERQRWGCFGRPILHSVHMLAVFEDLGGALGEPAKALGLGDPTAGRGPN